MNDYFDEYYEKDVKDDGKRVSPPVSKRTNGWLLTALLIVVFCFGYLTSFFINNFADSNISSTNTQSDILKKVLTCIRDKYIDDEISEQEWQEIISNAGTGAMHTLDDYGYLLSPMQYYDMFLRPTDINQWTGPVFGFSYQQIELVGLEIQSVLADSSAYGLVFEGEIITKIFDENDERIAKADGTLLNLKTDSTEEIVAVLAEKNVLKFEIMSDIGGQENTRIVQLTRVTPINNNRNGFYYVDYYFGDTRTNISTENSYGCKTTKEVKHLDLLEDSNVGYIALKEFNSTTDPQGTTHYSSDEFASAMTKFYESGRDYLILDLKGNPGGLVTEAQIIAQYFVRNVTSPATSYVVTTLHYRGGAQHVYRVQSSYASFFNLNETKKQIIVLTDENSASASELLLGAMIDYGTALQMGTRTFGKGIAQRFEPITEYPQTIVVDGNEITSYFALYYTAASYTSPNGNNIHGNGYVPSDDYNGLVDYADLIEKALEYFNS